MTDSRSDQRRFHNLTQEQLETLDQVLTEVIPIHGRGNFPTLEVKPKDIIHVVRDKLVAKEIKVRDVRLNGSTASHVLVKENGTSYKDLDIIFGVELPKQEDFQIIKEVVLSCLLDFLPQGVNKDKITALTMKEAYVQKMVKVFTEHDRWSLISLSNNSGKNVELKFVNSLRRQFEFSVDSFQIILDRMLESYLEAERRQAAEAQRAGAVAGAGVAGGTVAGAPIAPPTTPPTQSKAPPAHTQPTEADLPPPASTDTHTHTHTHTHPEPQQAMETAVAAALEPEATLEVVENGVSDSASLSENEPMQEDGASSAAQQASGESPEAEAAARHEKKQKEEAEEEEREEEEEEEDDDARPQQRAETASSEEQPGSGQTEAVPMDETRGELADNNKQSPDTQDRPEIATAEKDTDKASRAAPKEKEEEGEEEEEEEEEKKKREPEAPAFLTQTKAEASDHEEWLSETEAADTAEDQAPKSEATSEPMEVAEEAGVKTKAGGGGACVSSLTSPVSSPSPCPFLTQATPDSYLEYPLPPPAKKNTRSSQMVVLKHSSPKPPRKMSKKVAPQTAAGASEKSTARPPAPLPASATVAGPCKLLCPPKIDPTECVPMQVELAGATSGRPESPSCASTASEASRLPAFDPPAPALPAAVPSESRSAPEEEEEKPCESSSPDAHPHARTQTHDAGAQSQASAPNKTHDRTHTMADRQSPSLHRDQDTQTEPLPLPLEALLLPDTARPIIQVNSQPFVQVDEPSPSSSGPEPLPVLQVPQPAPPQEPNMQPEALSGSLSQQTNNVPVAIVAAGGRLTPAVSEPHISGPPEASDSPLAEPRLAEAPSEVPDDGYARQLADAPQPNPPPRVCEVAEVPVPSVSPTATMPLLVAEMPAETPVSPMWCPPDPVVPLPVPASVTSAHPPPPPPPPALATAPAREVLNVTVVAESMYGDFEQAMDHLRYRLIATRNPEEIRGGGLLKYSNLLVREFKPASETEIKTLERYMCSRFFIDFPDVNEQQRKIESYLRNHFIGEEKSKYDYLMTLRRVVDESTVCLMGHERRQTLNMITILALKVLGEQNIIPNTNNVTCFYQPAPYMADHNFSNYYIANGQSPVIYHPYPLHIHMQTGLV